MASALEDRGFRTSAVPWNGPKESWKQARHVIVRSTWDYVFFIDAFREWIRGLQTKATILNEPLTMQWNLDKTYLLGLQQKGVPMAKLEVVEPRPESLVRAMDNLNLERAVVKPLIGNSARGLSVVDKRDREGIEIAARKLSGSALLQEVVPNLREKGEISIIFFNGVYSHSVLKTPKHGEIRVQTEFGGKAILFDPERWMIDQAQQILGHCPSLPAYARVDVVEAQGSIRLMELELIEPDLFFDLFPEGAKNFVRHMAALDSGW